jgi:hypothetical protein
MRPANGIRSFTRKGSPNSGWKFKGLRGVGLNKSVA